MKPLLVNLTILSIVVLCFYMNNIEAFAFSINDDKDLKLISQPLAIVDMPYKMSDGAIIDDQCWVVGGSISPKKTTQKYTNFITLLSAKDTVWTKSIDLPINNINKQYHSIIKKIDVVEENKIVLVIRFQHHEDKYKAINFLALLNQEGDILQYKELDRLYDSKYELAQLQDGEIIVSCNSFDPKQTVNAYICRFDQDFNKHMVIGLRDVYWHHLVINDKDELLLCSSNYLMLLSKEGDMLHFQEFDSLLSWAAPINEGYIIHTLDQVYVLDDQMNIVDTIYITINDDPNQFLFIKYENGSLWLAEKETTAYLFQLTKLDILSQQKQQHQFPLQVDALYDLQFSNGSTNGFEFIATYENKVNYQKLAFQAGVIK